jgi:hypothetical protein
MVRTPIKKATVKVPKLKDPGLLFYKVAVRDAISRGDITQAKTLLKTAKDLRATGLDNLIADLEKAIAGGK